MLIVVMLSVSMLSVVTALKINLEIHLLVFYGSFMFKVHLRLAYSVSRSGEIPTFWLLWDTFYVTNFQMHKQFQHMVCCRYCKVSKVD